MPSTILNPGDPRFNGTSGPDSFTAPSGNSGINGFGGIDTVTFSFNLVDAAVSFHDNVVWIDTATSHTELTGIQTYVFNDGTVNEKDGNALVDDLFYYSHYHDIWNAHIEADTHYALYGWHEGRDPSAFFDTNLYLSLNQDVLASGVNPLVQFDTIGWTQNRQPSAAFNVQKYLAANPDVAAAHVDPLEHFLSNGVDEGRVPFPVNTIANSVGFDALYYLQTYADVKAAHVDPYQHFLNYGWHEGRNPNAYFDTLGYLATYTDVAAAGVNPLIHFDSNGWHEGRIPSPGFDAAAYLALYPDVAAAGVDPLAHFLKYGIDEGRVAIAKPIFDTNGAANAVLEGAAVGTNTGLSVSWGGWVSPNLWFSLSSDTSGGGFTINTLTGAVTVADSTKLDFETSGASHSYTIVVVAHDIGLSSTQSFTINIGDVTPTTPVDNDAAANTVVEGAANGSTVGVTLFSDEPNGPAVVYQLTDNAGGRFAVDPSTGVVTVANAALLDFESGAHSFTITGRTQVGAVFTPTQTFTINLTNAAPSTISDSNAASETVNEGAAVNTLVGIDADSTDPLGPAVIWSITSDSSGGGFKIDTNGVVSVADASKIDYENAPGVGHSYSIVVQASDGVGGTTSRNFSIVVNNVNPTTPTEVADGTPGGSVTEGAAADTLVGVQASASDVNGPAVTWSIINDPSGGGFKIDASGVISVADASKINYESAPGAGHSYDVVVQASDGQGGTSSQTFNILVTNVAPTTPTEVADGTPGGSVSEGASNGALVGITASSTDVNGPAVIWSITSDSSNLGLGGAFTINSSGVVSVTDATKLNYETAPGAGHSYDITIQASDGFNANSQSFNILVGNVNPTTPVDGDTTNDATGIQGKVAEGAAAGTLVGIDANSTDPNGPAVTWSILSGSASGGFQIDSNGIVSVLNGLLLNYENAPDLGGGHFGHTILVQASDGQGGTSTQTFTIELTNLAPAAPTDTDPVGDGAGTIKGIATFDATEGTLVGIHAQSAGDPAGGVVTYELAAGSSTFFQINAGTGEVSVSLAGQGNLVAGTDYDISVVAKDASGLPSGTSTATPFKVHVQGLAPGAPTDGDTAVANAVVEGTAGGLVPAAYTGLDADSSTAGVTFSLSADSSGGGFQIDSATGKVYIADGSLINYETPGHKYTVTVVASDGSLTSSTNFDINVIDVAPTQPIDADPSAGVLADPFEGRVAFDAANGSNVGITVSSTDVNGGDLTYELVTNTGGHFAINATNGVVTLASNAGLVAGTPLTFSARAVSTNGDTGTGTNVSAAQTFTVDVVASQPVVDLDADDDNSTAGNLLRTFTEGSAAVAVADTDVTITEAGFTTLASATVKLTNAQLGDTLTVGSLAGLGITANTVSGGGVITVTLSNTVPASPASFANYQTALKAITFSNTSDTPNTSVVRDVSVVVNDGTNPASNAAHALITVAATNDAPVLSAGGSPTVTFTENGVTVAPLTNGTVTDADLPANFVGGGLTVAVTAGTLQTGDQIVLLAGTGFTASGSSLIFGGNTIGTIAFGAGSATVTNLTTDATPTVVNALVKAFAFQSSSENPVTTDRVIDFTFNDGGNTGAGSGVSNTLHQTVHVAAVNDAPVAANGTLTVSEDSSANAGTLVATDVDNPTLTYSLVGASGGATHGTVIITNATTGAYTYTPAADYVGTDSFTFKANDSSVDSNNATVSITVNNPVNDAPVVTPATLAAVNEDTTNPAGQTVAAIFTGHFTDADAGSSLKGVAISNNAATGGQGTWQYSTNNGTSWFAVGSPTDTAALLLDANARLRFVPAADFNGAPGSLSAYGLDNTFDSGTNPFTSGATTHTFDANATHGGITPVSNAATTISTSITAVNDAPVNTVPFATQGVTENATNVAITGISVSDVDGNGGTETTQVSTSHGNLHVTLAGATISNGAQDSHSLTLSGTTAQISATLASLTYTPDSSYVGPDTLTVLSNDGGNTGGGAQTDTDFVPIAVSAPASATLTGQLWYVTRDGDTTAPSDNWVGHLNSDNTSITPTFDKTAINEKDIALDTAAGLFFVVDGLTLESRHTSDGTVADNTLDLSAFTSVDAVAIDPTYGTLFLSVTSASAATTGILEVTYNSTTGALTNTGNFLINQTATSVPAFVDAVDFSIDVGNRVLYYVDSSIPDSNAIYVVNYDGGGSPATTADAIPPTATLVSDTAVFLPDGSAGTIVAIAVDNGGDANPANDIVYFLTSDGAGGTNALWYIDRGSITPTLAAPVTGVVLTGETIHTGLSFDPISHSLFISDQGSSILQAHLDTVSTVTVTHTYTTAQLIGHAPTATPVPGATTFDVLPTLTLPGATPVFVEVNPTSSPVTLDGGLTLSDPDGYLARATVSISGGFAGDGDNLTISLTGTTFLAGDVTVTNVAGNVTLTLSGYHTTAEYQTALKTVAFISGDNPDNFGNNLSRTVAWHLDDGAAGDPHSTGNTKTSTIAITAANDAPVAGTDQFQGFEDTPITGQAVATDVDTLGPLTYSLVGNFVTNGTLTFNANGTFTFVPNANYNGSAGSFSFTASDGALTSSVDVTHGRIFLTSVAAVNDAPTFTISGTANVNEDAGAQSIASFLTAISVGPTVDETSGQTVSFVVTGNTNAGLFGVGPAIAANGTLSFTSAANAFGTATITFHAHDTGGTADGGVDNSADQTFTITVNPVNDAPVVDLDLSNNHGTLLDYNATYTVGGTPAAIADIDPSITDPDTATVAFATITLTNFVAGDLLSINGPLPAHITASAYDSGTGILTLTSEVGFAVTQAAYQQALQQVVFSTTSSDFTTVRDISVVVDDGGAVPHASAPAHAFITVSGNAAPVANPDSFTALEAGGLNNATAGNSPSGNLITGTGSATAVPDTDADGPVSALFVSAVDAVTTGGTVTGVVGTAMTGKYGSLTVNSNGSYAYSLDNTNAAVQALVPAGATLADVFHYTIKDASGAASSSAAITITISGADDTALASADVGSMSEDAAATTFVVRANDTLDPDAPATNAITLLGGATAVGNGSASGLGIDITDVTRSVNGSNEIVVTLSGSDFQKLKVGDTATITLPYRLAGDTQNSDSSLTITVNGANDLPVAVDDTGGSMSEDAATTPFTVIGNDTLDVDRTAPTAATPGLVTTGTVTAVGNLTASGKVTGSDVTVGVNASNQITVSLGANFQKLSAGETATIDVTYLLHGDGADTSTAHLQVTVNGANDAPVVDLLNTAGLQTTGVTSTFTENGPVPPSVPVTVLPQVTLSDIDSTTLASATVTLTNAQTGVDVLTLSGQAGTSGTLNSGGSVDDDINWSIDTSTPGQISVNFTDAAGGNAPTLANYQSALQLIQFNNASDNPTQTDRTFTVTINDGVTTNAATTATLDFVAINDNPVNTVPGAQNAITTDTDYAFNGAKTISVSDADAGSGLIHTTLSAVHGDLTVTLGGATVFTGTNGTHTVGLQGTVTQINAALATLVYNSDAGYTDADTLQILTNDQGNSPAPAQSDTDTVSLNIIPKVWYIDDSVGAQSDATHFTSLAAFNTAHNAVSAANAPSFIYVRFGNDGVYSDTDGINLKPGEILLGQGADLTYNKTNGGTATLETGSSGLTPTITVTGGAGNAGVTLAQNNTLSGFNIAVSGADGIGIEDSNGAGAAGAVGTLKVGLVGISGVGKAIDIDQGGTLTGVGVSTTATFTSIASTGSNTEGIQLGGIAGSLLGGSFAVTGTTSVTNAVGNAIQVLNTGAGASFNFGTSTTVNDTAVGGHTANGINLVTGIGATNGFTFGNLSVTTDGGYGLTAVNAGTLTFGVGTNSINTTGGAAIDVTGTATTLNNATFSTVTSSGGAFGVNLANQTGAFTANAGTLSGHSTSEINLSGGNANVTYAGTIGNGTGNSVQIASKTGGTTTISGAINDTNDAGGGISITGNTGGTIDFTNGTKTLNTGASDAVVLTNNNGATINFTGGGLDIDTTTGKGFNATGAGPGATTGGTITVTGSGNTIDSTSGTALKVLNTTIGANDLTFQRISSGSGASSTDTGIILDNTGSTGGLHVIGTGAAGSGGIIQNKTGADGSTATGIGIYLNNTSEVQLAWMQLNDFQNFGIMGTGVNGFIFDHSVVNGTNGTSSSLHEASVAFGYTNVAGATSGLIGSATISNSTFGGGSIQNTVQIRQGAGTLDRLTISNSNFASLNPIGDALSIETNGNAVTKVTVQNSFFTSAAGDLFQWNGVDSLGGTGTGDLVFTGNTLTNNNPAIATGGGGVSIGSGGDQTFTFNIANNTIRDAKGHAVLIVHDVGTGSMTGAFSNNQIGVAGTANSGSLEGAGLKVQHAGGGGLLDIDILNNQIRQYNNEGILLQDGAGLAQSGTFVAEVAGNTVSNPGTNASIGSIFQGFALNSGVTPGDSFVTYLTLGGDGGQENTFTGSGRNGGVDMRIRARQNTDVNITANDSSGSVPAAPNATYHYTGGTTDAAAVATFLAQHNAGTQSHAAFDTGEFKGASPPFPSSLMAANGHGPGGVESLTSAALAPILAEAVARWSDAGITADQMMQLQGVAVTIDDLSNGIVAQTSGQHIAIDFDAAGWGWFADPTPLDNVEFGVAHSVTELAAAGGEASAHIDLLTAVMHELGHVLGLEHSHVPGDLMDDAVDLGIRRLPSAEDVAAASADDGTAAVQTLAPGQSATGTSGADTFVITSAAASVHIADYSAAQGDAFDFSGLQVADAAKVRVIEDASDAFATLQIDIGADGPIMRGAGAAPASHWVSVAQVDGVHAGDAIDVWLNPAQIAHLHAGLLG
jgi:VCBS repeat-containing protein